VLDEAVASREMAMIVIGYYRSATAWGSTLCAADRV
jgi:hypothetical protein